MGANCAQQRTVSASRSGAKASRCTNWREAFGQRPCTNPRHQGRSPPCVCSAAGAGSQIQGGQLCARLPLRSPTWKWVEGALGFRLRQGNGAQGFGVSLPDHLLASHFLRAVAHGYFRTRRLLHRRLRAPRSRASCCTEGGVLPRLRTTTFEGAVGCALVSVIASHIRRLAGRFPKACRETAHPLRGRAPETRPRRSKQAPPMRL